MVEDQKHRRWFWWPEASCREVVRLTSEALDRKLTGREFLAVRLHFLVCFLCRRYERHLRALHQGLHQHGHTFGETSTASLSEEEKSRMKKACADR